jgi:tetratricopeptide (TPR) repeat protein
LSTKKDKFLESAQKFILKGQLDRAIRDYEQIVALDPKDIRHRQRLAELFVRTNRKEEAIGEYEAIGKYYADNSYYLKAIAVYKQIQKLDPDNIKLSLNLAYLNEKQGLIGNALAEYSRVHSYYEKIGKREDALSIIESMIALDPENLNTRLKFAEARFAVGNADKAYDDFVQLALLLKTRGDESAYGQVCQRVNYLFPEKKGFVLELLAAQLQCDAASSVIPEIREITRREQGNLAAWQLLINALRSSGEREELKVVCQKMVSLFPGDLSSREGAVQCALDEGDTDGALLLLEMHSTLFFEKEAYEALEKLYSRLQDLLPGDKRVLLGLKNLYEASGSTARFADVADQLDLLTQEKVEDVARIQQEELPLVAEEPDCSAASVTPVEEPAWEEEIEIDLPADGFVDPVDSPGEDYSEPLQDTSTGDSESLANPYESENTDLELELELPAEGFVQDTAIADHAGLAAAEAPDEAMAVDLELDFSDEGFVEHTAIADQHGLAAAEVSDEAMAVDLELDFSDEGFAEHTAIADQHGLAAAEVSDEAMAVDLELDLSDEGFVEHTAIADQHGPSAAEVSDEAMVVDLELDLSDERFVEHTAIADQHGLAAAEVSDEAMAVDLELDFSDEGFSEHTEFVNESGLPADEVPDDVAAVDPELELELELSEELFDEQAESDALTRVDLLVVDDLSAAMIAEGETADYPSPDSDVTRGIELAEEHLLLELVEDPLPELKAEEAAATAGNENSSPDIIFSAVRKGLDQQLDKEDTETHYNLGIAFMEMGLYEDAITEFQAAALDPKRKVDCITSQGICCRNKGDYSRAEDIFTKGLTIPGLVSEESASLKYELALLYETEGRHEDALLLYREIHAVNRGFRDTAKKIAEFNREEAQEFYDLDLVDPDDEIG